jgi:hypothetical protein
MLTDAYCLSTFFKEQTDAFVSLHYLKNRMLTDAFVSLHYLKSRTLTDACCVTALLKAQNVC